MTQFVFANGVQTTLAAAITATDTTLVVASTANLPTIAAGQQCPAVLGTLALFEIVYITNINSSTLTITRGQENTAAQSWGLGTQFEISVTAGSIAAAQIIGTLGGALTGTLPNPGMASGAASANIGTLGGALTGTLPNPGIGSGVVTGANIAGSTVTGTNIAGSTITGTNIASGTVTEGNMASGAIHRAQLSTATASGNIGGGGGTGWNGTYSLAGGNYSWPTASASNYANSNSALDAFFVFGSGGQGQGVLGIAVYGGGSASINFYIQENYINSSPPYNFGEAFVYVAFDKQGKIVGISAALDPTWAHHGPHSIVPTHRSKSGKPLVYQDMLDGVIFSEAMKDKARRLAYLKGELTKERGEVEITVDYKDTDMHTHPHPFGSDSVARVILMHPDSACNNGLVDMLKAGHASEIVTMIEDGDLIPGTDLIAHPYSPIPTVKMRLR